MLYSIHKFCDELLSQAEATSCTIMSDLQVNHFFTRLRSTVYMKSFLIIPKIDYC